MQGFNMGRYMPPASLDPSLSHDHIGGFNHQNDTRPRAPDGSIVVRFEMPFKIWCSGCYPESIIDQGSRFNATKKSTGKFFTTTIYEFKMKHADCGKTIVIATDPLNQTYKMVSGGRRQDHEFKSMDEGGDVGEPLDHSNPRDPFAAQEAARYAARKNDSATSDIEELQKISERQWKNPHDNNSQMRKHFRESKGGRWERDRHRQEGEAIAEKYSLSTPVPAPTKEDNELARNITFGQTAAQFSEAEERFIKSQSIFDTTPMKPLARPHGMKDQAWNNKKQRDNLKQSAKIQLAEMGKDPWAVGVKRKKRSPEEILSKITGRNVTRRKTGTADTPSEVAHQPCKSKHTFLVCDVPHG